MRWFGEDKELRGEERESNGGHKSTQRGDDARAPTMLAASTHAAASPSRRSRCAGSAIHHQRGTEGVHPVPGRKGAFTWTASIMVRVIVSARPRASVWTRAKGLYKQSYALRKRSLVYMTRLSPCFASGCCDQCAAHPQTLTHVTRHPSRPRRPSRACPFPHCSASVSRFLSPRLHTCAK